MLFVCCCEAALSDVWVCVECGESLVGQFRGIAYDL